MRINKFIASSGVASRRKSEELVLSGRIKVNGKVEKNLATDIRRSDIVTLDDNKIEIKQGQVYLLMHKPKGYICTNSDDKGRKTVMDLLQPKYSRDRLFAVGRLDYDTEGLLLLTNDGDMANRLMHPRFEVPKTYVAKIEGEISADELKKLSNGIMLDGTLTKKCKVRLLGVDNEPVDNYREHGNGNRSFDKNNPNNRNDRQNNFNNRDKFNNSRDKFGRSRQGNNFSNANAQDRNFKQDRNNNGNQNSDHPRKNAIISKIEIVIVEGRNRQVRRMFEAINRQVIFLKRTQIGEISLGGLTRGTTRELRPDELKFLSKV